MRELTIGEKRVRIEFNPSNQDNVFRVKTKIAELINEAEAIKATVTDPEAKRLAALASTDLENAAMWLVKALTA